MKKSFILTFFVLLFSFSSLSAHNIWVETKPTGEVGNTQQIHIYYGEYSYDYYEKVDGNFQDVADFNIWAITPGGQKILLSTTPGKTKFTAEFTPNETGVYTILLSSTKAGVVDWTAYGLGILKPNFYASTTVVVGDKQRSFDAQMVTKINPLVIDDGSHKTYSPKSNVDLIVLFDGEPVAEQKLIITIADQWSKTITTNENGIAEFTLPWKGQYIVEAVHTEENAGKFKGIEFEATRHTATYSIKTD